MPSDDERAQVRADLARHRRTIVVLIAVLTGGLVALAVLGLPLVWLALYVIAHGTVVVIYALRYRQLVAATRAAGF